jgi:hypothetical protein
MRSCMTFPSKIVLFILINHYFRYRATDRLENELMGELENARLFRLMCKFGFINERPECVFFVLFSISPPSRCDALSLSVNTN